MKNIKEKFKKIDITTWRILIPSLVLILSGFIFISINNYNTKMDAKILQAKTTFDSEKTRLESILEEVSEPIEPEIQDVDIVLNTSLEAGEKVAELQTKYLIENTFENYDYKAAPDEEQSLRLDKLKSEISEYFNTNSDERLRYQPYYKAVWKYIPIYDLTEENKVYWICLADENDLNTILAVASANWSKDTEQFSRLETTITRGGHGYMFDDRFFTDNPRTEEERQENLRKVSGGTGAIGLPYNPEDNGE